MTPTKKPKPEDFPEVISEWTKDHVAAVVPKDLKGFQLQSIDATTPIIGLTGALGSGSTFFAEGVSKFHDYFHWRLSSPIHELASISGHDNPSFEILQDIGNRLRFLIGPDVLVWLALRSIDNIWKKKRKTKGILLDGVRNVGEIRALRRFPFGFLISIQAEQETREQRLIDSGRCKNHEEFLAANIRDQEERGDLGQQITLCNYHADIVVPNEKNIAPNVETEYSDYIEESAYKRYIRHIEYLSDSKQDIGFLPNMQEALMTAAYVTSKRSSCLKRKVGAIIATKDGEILSSGYNEVPRGSQSCLKDPRYNECARDLIQQKIGKKLKHCPKCGKKIELKFSCYACGKKLTEFLKKCPHCEEDPQVQYTCDECGTDVYDEFVSGMSKETGKLLDVCRALHAEENAILNLLKGGAVIPSDAVLYTTTFPCNLCANKIVNAGISKIVFCEPYVTKEATTVLKQGGMNGNNEKVSVEPFRGVKSTAFFRLYR